MNVQSGYEVWRVAGNRYETKRQIPSYQELMASCNLSDDFAIYACPRRASLTNRTYQPISPFSNAYGSPPPSTPSSFGHSRKSSALSSPNKNIFPLTDPDNKDSVQTLLDSEQAVLNTPMLSEPELETAAYDRKNIKIPVTNGKHLSKNHKRKAEGVLMRHEKVLFVLEPRPATEYTAGEIVFPQNAQQKQLCLRKRYQCGQCGSKKTPEWRSGPAGSRTLCNACGLFFAKLTKKMGHEKASSYFLEMKNVGNVLDRRIGTLRS